MKHQLTILFLNTLQKEYRKKTLIFFLILTFLLSLGLDSAVPFLDMIGDDEKFKIICYFINVWSLLLAISMGSDCLSSDLKENVFIQIISLPLDRWTYILSRLLGLAFIVLGYYFISVVCALILFPAWNISWINLMAAFFINFTTVSGMILLSMFLSIHLPRIPSLIFCFILYTLTATGETVAQNFSWNGIFSDMGILKAISIFIYLFIPHLSSLNAYSRGMMTGSEYELYIPFEILHFLGTSLLIFYGIVRALRNN